MVIDVEPPEIPNWDPAPAGEADERATVTAEVADLATQNRSPRLARELHATRVKMEPWSQRPAVKHLDDRLAAYGLR
jgi:hypothetical protein